SLLIFEESLLSFGLPERPVLLRSLSMSKAFEEIAKEATQLSRKQRLDLASLLLELNDEAADADVSDEWEQEILARIRAVDEGQVEGISFEAVMREAEDR